MEISILFKVRWSVQRAVQSGEDCVWRLGSTFTGLPVTQWRCYIVLAPLGLLWSEASHKTRCRPLCCCSGAAGIEIFRAAGETNRARKVVGLHPLRFGLGCNSGNVCIGAIGTSERMSTLTISDAVQVAGNAEARTRQLSTNMVVTAQTYELLTVSKEQFRKVELSTDPSMLGTWLYECIAACWTPEEQEAKMRTRDAFETGLTHFVEQRQELARTTFEVCCEARGSPVDEVLLGDATDGDQ